MVASLMERLHGSLPYESNWASRPPAARPSRAATQQLPARI